MRTIVMLKYIEAKDEWKIKTINGFTLQEVQNCENMPKLFEELNKEELNMYSLKIKKIGSKPLE